MRHAKQSYLLCEGDWYEDSGMDGEWDEIDVVWICAGIFMISMTAPAARNVMLTRNPTCYRKGRSWWATMEKLKSQDCRRGTALDEEELDNPRGLSQEGQQGYSINSLGKFPNIPVCRLILLPILLPTLLPNQWNVVDMLACWDSWNTCESDRAEWCKVAKW